MPLLNRMMFGALLVVLVLAAFLDVSGLLPGAGQIALPVLILGAGAFVLLRALRPARAATRREAVAIPRDGAARAALDLKLGAGDLSLTTGGAADSLLSGDFAGAVQPTVDDAGAVTAIKLRQPFSLAARRRAAWQMALNPAVTWTRLRLTLGSTAAELDLAALQGGALLVEAVSTTLDAKLPQAGEVELNLAGGRAVLRIPPGTSAEVRSEVRIGEVTVNNARLRIVDPGGERVERWRTGEGEPALRVLLKGGLGSIEIA